MVPQKQDQDVDFVTMHKISLKSAMFEEEVVTLIYDTTRAGGGGLPRRGGGVSKFCLKSCKLKMFQILLMYNLINLASGGIQGGQIVYL